MHALGARREYHGLLAVLSDIQTQQSRLVWFHLTSFLHHAAMISKFLAPISKGEVTLARRAALRGALSVAADSEVLSRDARDNMEHFDERIDRWIEDKHPTIIEIVLPDRESYEYLGIADKRVKRLLVADELVFISERKDGTKFELALRPVYEEIGRIGRASDKWIGHNSPYVFLYPIREG